MSDEAYPSSSPVLSSRAQKSGTLVLNASLPFSRHLKPSTLIRHATHLVRNLNLSADVRIIAGNGQAGLNCERRFRMKWWTSGDEPLRAALHKAKVLIYSKARTTQCGTRLAEAWEQSERIVRSRLWRDHLLLLLRETNHADNEYLRLVYRIAQQAWTRAARWQAILSPEGSSPFIPLVELLAAGAFPLGCYENSLWVFVWNAAIPDAPDFGPPLVNTCSPAQKDYVFLSTQFRDTELTAGWETAFRNRGWNTVHGPVSEEVAPPEPQLGKRIREARAIVGLIAESDHDFGMPWWMYQELDYACAWERPTILVSQSSPTEPGLRGMQKIQCSMGDSPDNDNKREIWRWLQHNAVLF